MREETLSRRSSGEDVRRALSLPSPLRLRLLAAPDELSREALLSAVASRACLLVARFEGTLATPLVETALLADEAEWVPGSALDVTGALLFPLAFRVGEAQSRRLLASTGAVLSPGSALRAFSSGQARSPVSLALSARLLDAGRRGGLAPALAREKAAFRLVMALADRNEGVRAFLERRPPRFDW